MNQAKLTGLCLLLLGLAPALPAAAQDEAAWRDFDLLNGRLVVSAPASADFEELQAGNIMAADPSKDVEAKLRVPAAGTEIVVYVSELFALYPIDPAAFFRDEVWGGEVPPRAPAPGHIAVEAPLSAYGVAGQGYPHPSGNNVLASLLLAQSDGTVHYVYLMTWDVDSETLKRVGDIAERIVLSLRPGPRQGLQAGGSRVLDSLPWQGGGERELTLAVPEGYAFWTERGPDFSVHHVARLTRLGEAGSGSLGIYIGYHPSYHFARQGLRPEDLRRVPNRVLGLSGEWLEHSSPGAGGGTQWIDRETILRLESSLPAWMLHIFLAAPEGSQELAELTRITEEGLSLRSP